MKWKASEPIAPTPGTTRTKTRFALRPRKIGNAWYWLCQYEVLQVWHVETVPAMVGGQMRPFEVAAWRKISEKPVKWVAA